MNEIQIDGAPGVVTMIHSYTTTPETQDSVQRGLIAALDRYGEYMAGHIASSIHKSLDGLRVTSYSQWDTMRSKALFGDPAKLQQSLDWFAPYTQAATGQDAHVYGQIALYRPAREREGAPE